MTSVKRSCFSLTFLLLGPSMRRSLKREVRGNVDQVETDLNVKKFNKGLEVDNSRRSSKKKRTYSWTKLK